MRRVIATLTVLVVLSIPYSCDDGCEPITNINTLTEISLDIGIRTPVFESRQTVSSDEAIFYVTVEDLESELLAAVDGFDGFSPKAYAESCPEFIELKYDLIELKIYSSVEVTVGGQDFAPGQDLSNAFSGKEPYEGRFVALDEIVNIINDDPFYFTSAGSNIDFKLNQLDATMEGAFTFEFTFSNNSVLRATQEVILQVD